MIKSQHRETPSGVVTVPGCACDLSHQAGFRTLIPSLF